MLIPAIDGREGALIEYAIAARTYGEFKARFEDETKEVREGAVRLAIQHVEKRCGRVSERAWDAYGGPAHSFLMILLEDRREFARFVEDIEKKKGVSIKRGVPLVGRRRGERLAYCIERATGEHLDVETTGEWDFVLQANATDHDGNVIATGTFVYNEGDDVFIPCDWFDTGFIVHPDMRGQGLADSVLRTLGRELERVIDDDGACAARAEGAI